MKSAQRQFLVKVAGVPGLWMTKSGGEITASTSKMYDGGKHEPDVISSAAEASDVTVTRGYNPDRDPELTARFRRQVGRFRTTLSVTPTDEDLVPLRRSPPETYPNALLVGFTPPPVDAAGGDGAVYELTFAVAGWT